MCACVGAKLLQLWPTLCDLMDCTCQAPLVHGILQTRMSEWIAVPLSGDLPDPGIKPASLLSPGLAGRFLTFSIT